MTGHTSLPMEIERPWLWIASVIGLFAASAVGVVFMGGQDSIEFQVKNTPSDDSVVLTVEREDGESLEQIHRTTVTDSRETTWTATEPGYYEVTLATDDQSCTRGLVLETIDSDLTVANDDIVDWSGCPAMMGWE